MKNTCILAAGAIAMLAAGAPVCAAPISKAEADKIIATVKATEARWNDDIKTRDPAKFASYYTDDATFMNPGAPVVRGRAAIDAAMKQTFADPNFTLSFASDEAGVSASGDLAYTQGHCQVSETDPGSHQKVSMPCSYVTLFKLGADGTWRAVEDIATPSPAGK